MEPKCIAVLGQFTAIGKPTYRSWSRLNTTAYAGSNKVVVKDNVPWSVGEQVVLAPTGYFTASGGLWSDVGGSVEILTILSVTLSTSDEGTVLTLSGRLNQTHLCTVVEGESFCGAVGLLSRSIVISSRDSEDPRTNSFGFGGHIAVLDLFLDVDDVSTSFSGSVTFRNVEFKNLGQSNSDSYGILVSSNSDRKPSVVSDCSFYNSYNIAVRACRCCSTRSLLNCNHLVASLSVHERSCCSGECGGKQLPECDLHRKRLQKLFSGV